MLNVYAGDHVVRLGPRLLVAAHHARACRRPRGPCVMGKLALARAPPPCAAALIAIMSVFVFAGTSRARADDAALMDAALNTHLAYIITGNPSVDAMSRAGLVGLSERLTAKTALEPDKPVGLDIERDRDHPLPADLLAGDTSSKRRSAPTRSASSNNISRPAA